MKIREFVIGLLSRMHGPDTEIVIRVLRRDEGNAVTEEAIIPLNSAGPNGRLTGGYGPVTLAICLEETSLKDAEWRKVY